MPEAQSTLVLGGAASGKSAFSENLVLRMPGRPVYIATAQAFDAEMTGKIALHRARRGDLWTTVEEPLDLARAIAGVDTDDAIVLVDCLTLWLSNVMHAELDITAETKALRDALDRAQGPVVCVSNEVGLGIVPATKLGREFRDAAGRLNQFIAAQADRVEFIAAGLPITLKNETS